MDSLGYYLFSLVTDHAPLCWIHTIEDLNPYIMLLYLAPQQQVGKDHANAALEQPFQLEGWGM